MPAKKTKTKRTRKAASSTKQKAALAKGQKIQKRAMEIMKKGGKVTETVSKYKIPLAKAMKMAAKG